MSASGVRARKRTSVTSCEAKETRRSCPPLWLKDEAVLAELRLRQSSSSESKDKRSGQPSSGGNGFDVEKVEQPLRVSAGELLNNGGRRDGQPELDSHGGDILEDWTKLRTAAGSNLVAVMVVVCLVINEFVLFGLKVFSLVNF